MATDKLKSVVVSVRLSRKLSVWLRICQIPFKIGWSIPPPSWPSQGQRIWYFPLRRGVFYRLTTIFPFFLARISPDGWNENSLRYRNRFWVSWDGIVPNYGMKFLLESSCNVGSSTLFDFFEFSSKVICMLCRYIGNLVENWLELNPIWN